ncbi:MAG: Ig domain-containing protein [Bacteroidales bacterium]|nr:Ig domain-containing protein [Bacteroidales bacterium]
MSIETFSTNDTVNGHYIAGVPEGWLILALGDTVPVSNDSLRRTTPITEGAPVTIVPTGNLRRIKSITLVDESTPVESITLNKTATTISAGNTETLSVSSVTPDDATDQTVTWSSDNEAVATVDADGKVTAVAFGTANITATANDGSGVTATCAVTVSKVVTINQSDWGGWDTPITKDGVTVSADMIDPHDGNLMGGGTFSTTLGNFTKIVVTTSSCNASGTGWSGSGSSMTWAGTPASTVSFSGEFMGMGMTQTTIVCTIEPAN